MSWMSKVKALGAFAEQKASEVDAKLSLSGKARALSASAQEKWKAVDERHQVSTKVNQVAAKAQEATVKVVTKINAIDEQHKVSAKVSAGVTGVTQKVEAFAIKHQIQERVKGAVTHLDEKLGVTDDGYRAKMEKKLGVNGLEAKGGGAGIAEAKQNDEQKQEEGAESLFGDEEEGKTQEKAAKEVAECPICLECILDASCDPIVCGHQFHRSCLKEWLHESSLCPLCRATVVRTDSSAEGSGVAIPLRCYNYTSSLSCSRCYLSHVMLQCKRGQGCTRCG
jgi:hypothetical protein